MKYKGNTNFSHSQKDKLGVLITNLGTPESPTSAALRPYLKEFLSDPRVVEIPRPVWKLILNLFVLPLRPKRIAPAYAEIWNQGLDGEAVTGSPITYYTQRQVELLQQRLQTKLPDGVAEAGADSAGCPVACRTRRAGILVDALWHRGQPGLRFRRPARPDQHGRRHQPDPCLPYRSFQCPDSPKR